MWNPDRSIFRTSRRPHYNHDQIKPISKNGSVERANASICISRTRKKKKEFPETIKAAACIGYSKRQSAEGSSEQTGNGDGRRRGSVIGWNAWIKMAYRRWKASLPER